MSNHPSRRVRAYVSLSCVLVLLGVLCWQVVLRNDAVRARAVWNSFLGTWASDGGAILQLRADGSARVRYPRSPSVPVSSFQWEISNGRLLFANSPRKPKTVNAIVYGALTPSGAITEDIDRMEIVEVTADQARLIALPHRAGKATYPMKWARVDDAILDLAP